jgi:nucleoside-diphosphate-sugar epimerase
MKVLITGGKGFIGSQIAKSLNQLDLEVFTLSRSESIGNTSHFNVDIFEEHKVRQVLQRVKPEIVVHAAWDTTLETYEKSLENLKFQKAGLQFALECAAHGVKKLVMLGSSAEYGLQFAPVSADTSIATPFSEYGKAKYALLKSLENRKIQESLDFTWLRIFQPYGPMQSSERLFPTLLKKIHEGSDFVFNFPNQIRDWIHVIDICKVVIFVIENNLTGILDVGTGIGTRNSDLLSCMGKVINGNSQIQISPEHLDSNDNDILVVHPEAGLFRAGWKPIYDLETGIRQTLAHI